MVFNKVNVARVQTITYIYIYAGGRRRERKRIITVTETNREEILLEATVLIIYIYTEFKSLVVNDACVVYEDTDR